MRSVLWRCWLGGRKGIWPVQTECWGASVVVCLEQGADLHMAQLMPLPVIVSCFSKIQSGFTFLVLAHLGSPRKRAIKRVCVLLECFYCFYSVCSVTSGGQKDLTCPLFRRYRVHVPIIAPSRGGIRTPSNTWFLVLPPNYYTSSWAICAWGLRTYT